MTQQNTVIVIVGPTASGKTALALQLAQYLNTSIISADSRQCFRELNIGVAKPTEEELGLVKHYFINSHSVTDNVTAQTFEEYSLQVAGEIFANKRYLVMAGGTGLYIKAFCEGLDEIPAIDAGIRANITAQYNQYGLNWLQQQVQQQDPVYWQAGEQQNPQRLMRALEVKLGTGQSITSWQKRQPVKRPFNIIKFGIDLPRADLYNNINSRVDVMVQAGLEEEVRNLVQYRHCNALQTVGYKEFFDFFDHTISLNEAITAIKTNTRHYAKRQLTWFRKDPSIIWKPYLNADVILDVLKNT